MKTTKNVDIYSAFINVLEQNEDNKFLNKPKCIKELEDYKTQRTKQKETRHPFRYPKYVPSQIYQTKAKVQQYIKEQKEAEQNEMYFKYINFSIYIVTVL
jgi:hypothetical protein